jgi:hypothetical protein
MSATTISNQRHCPSLLAPEAKGRHRLISTGPPFEDLAVRSQALEVIGVDKVVPSKGPLSERRTEELLRRRFIGCRPRSVRVMISGRLEQESDTWRSGRAGSGGEVASGPPCSLVP